MKKILTLVLLIGIGYGLIHYSGNIKSILTGQTKSVLGVKTKNLSGIKPGSFIQKQLKIVEKQTMQLKVGDILGDFKNITNTASHAGTTMNYLRNQIQHIIKNK